MTKVVNSLHKVSTCGQVMVVVRLVVSVPLIGDWLQVTGKDREESVMADGYFVC